MAFGDTLTRRERRISWAATLIITVMIGFGLFAYRYPTVLRDVSDGISAIALNAPEPPPPPPTEPAEQPAAPNPEGAAAPPNRRNDPTPIVAPPPKLTPRPAANAAPIAGPGSASESGAAPTPGPGTGAGGEGTGRGAGNGGDGTGGGGGGARARYVRGGIGYRDWPRDLTREDRVLRVEVRFWVETNGRVTGCETQRTSGIAALDTSTCRLIEQRFRYEPARNSAGQPIRSEMAWQQTWEASRGD
jgi:periplasmic protein TonB